MAKLIITKDEEILRKRSRPVDVFDARLWRLLDDMRETLDAVDGVGLAAVQIGVLWRVFIINTPQGYVEFINPEIVTADDYKTGEEGCLSVPKIRGMVNRPNKLTVRARNRNGKLFQTNLEKLYAVCFSHEADHLDGILFTDKVIDENLSGD